MVLTGERGQEEHCLTRPDTFTTTERLPAVQCTVYSVYSEPGTEWGAAQVLTTIPTPGHSPVSNVDTTVWS